MNQDLKYEQEYWGNCCNTFAEDQKHYVYGKLMGLNQNWIYFHINNKSVLDIGGGPSSMLLKVYDLVKGKIYDPIEYPKWTVDRYNSKNIEVVVDYGENINESGWDEVWIYNCLQHVTDPEKIIKNALKAGKILRIFEWVDIPAHEGHPHMLTEENLNKWIGQEGRVTSLNAEGCYGKAYYGVFESNEN